MTKTKSQIAEIIIDIVCVVLVAVLLGLAINILAQKPSKGYVAYFGKITADVASGSMDGSYTTADYTIPSFKAGDSVVIQEYKTAEEKIANIEIGDVITFWQLIGGSLQLNSHRVIDILYDGDGVATSYITQGDANNSADSINAEVNVEAGKACCIVGEVIKVNEGGGGLGLFLASSTGVLVCVVVPSIIIVGYFVVLLIVEIVKRKQKVATISAEELRKQLEEEVRAQMMKEMEEKAAKEAAEKDDK